jgi:outer membrane protein TolC
LYEAGRISEFDVNDAANRVLSAESSLASRRESYALSLDRFKVRLGIPVTEPLQINGVRFLLDAPEVTLEEATESALTYRLDLQNTADRVLDTARELDNAENNLLPDLGIGGQVALPTDPNAREGGAVFDPEEADLSANFNLSLPLDRENERLRLRESQIRLQRSQRAYDRIRDEVILEVRQRVRNIDLARFRLELAQRQVEINERRQEEQRIKADEVDTNRRLDTEADLLNSLNARDQATTDLRISILNYLLSAGRLRVDLAGQLAPLDGMMLEFIDTPMSYPELFGPVGGVNEPALPPEPMTVDEQQEEEEAEQQDDLLPPEQPVSPEEP